MAGIDSTLYCLAIGSSQNFKFETWYQVNLSFAIASFQALASLSKDTPTILRPLKCRSLYIATTFGFSALQGPHQEAQKSTIVTLPKHSFREITFPSGLGPEKSALHLASAAGAGAGAGGVVPTDGDFISASFAFTALPGFVFFRDSSKPLYIFSDFLESALGSFNIP